MPLHRAEVQSLLRLHFILIRVTLVRPHVAFSAFELGLKPPHLEGAICPLWIAVLLKGLTMHVSRPRFKLTLRTKSHILLRRATMPWQFLTPFPRHADGLPHISPEGGADNIRHCHSCRHPHSLVRRFMILLQTLSAGGPRAEGPPSSHLFALYAE